MKKKLAEIPDTSFGAPLSSPRNRKRRPPKRSASEGKRKRFLHVGRVDQQLPTQRLKRLFMKNGSLHGVKADAVRALNASISAFIMDLLHGMVLIAIDEAGKQGMHQQLKLTCNHLHSCLAEGKEKFDFLVDLFSNKHSYEFNHLSMIDGDQLQLQDDSTTSIKRGQSTANASNQLLSASNASIRESNTGSSAITNSVRMATSKSISSTKNMALSLAHDKDFGNLRDFMFEGEETDFN